MLEVCDENLEDEKVVRSVGAAALSDGEHRRAQARGAERMMKAGRATIQRRQDTLIIDYHVGHLESVPYTELQTGLQDLKQQLAGQCISVLDVAIYHPDHFWLFYYHKLSVEDALRRIGAAARK